MEKKLGFGLMRLPRKDGAIDVETVAKMAAAYLDEGFTYFDTAYVYEGSEEAFRKAVVERQPRERFTVADKLPAWHLSPTTPPEALFAESLRRCGVDTFDFYLLHNINERSAPIMDEYKVWDFVKRMRDEGKVKHMGFSFHGQPPLLEETLAKHPEVEFVQLQINYMDWEDAQVQSRVNYEIVRRYGKDITVMEPVKGGILAKPREDALAKLTALGTGASASSYALRYVAGLPGVRFVLSGMGTEAQMADNIATFRDFQPLSKEEEAAVFACRDAMLSTPTVGCTACRYCCEGCPMGINIPEIIKVYNRLLVYGDHPGPHDRYRDILNQGSAPASACIACGQCESVCPQNLPIIETLQKASAILD